MGREETSSRGSQTSFILCLMLSNVESIYYRLPGDITSKSTIQSLASKVASLEPSGIHLLVNNAGIAHDDNTKFSQGRPDMSSAEQLSDHMLKSEMQDWQDTFLANVTSHYFVTAAFLPLLGK